MLDLLPSGYERFVNVEELKKILTDESYNSKKITESDYLFKGFLYLGLKKLEKAKFYLSKAIEMNFENEIFHFLQSLVSLVQH